MTADKLPTRSIDTPNSYRLVVELRAPRPGINRNQAAGMMEDAHNPCVHSQALRGHTHVTLRWISCPLGSSSA